MSEELSTVEEAAERLKLHPKTVLRFIREGRLKATRVGRAYRISRADLDAFAGVPVRSEPQASQSAWATSIVDLPDVGPEVAQKWARSVTNALQARPAGGAPLRADVVYDPDRRQMKIVAVGAPADLSNLLGLIAIWVDQLRP